MTEKLKNQLAAMKDQLFGLSQDKAYGRIIKNSSWRRLPAIKSFEVIVNEYNGILEKLGINLRIPSNIKSEKNTTDRANRYMKHQILRIRKYKTSNPKLAWHIALSCIKRSVSFRLSAINYVIPGWFFNKSISEIWSISRMVSKIINTNDDNLKFHRVYIPKPNGKYRPLGVASPAWRIVLHMHNNMLYEMVGHEIKPSQHAYVPGKGLLTAWKDLISKFLNHKYVYETDLKGFFDNIERGSIFKIFERNNMPAPLYHWYYNICLNQPKLTLDDKLDESMIRDKEAILNSKNNIDFSDSNIVYNLLTKFMNESGSTPEMIRQWMIEDDCADVEEWMQLQWSLFDSFGVSNFGDLFKGVPQGMPFSPLMSILPLHDLYLNQQEYVNYADDQVFFGNEPFIIKDNPSEGIIHNEEKCGWVKYDGEFTKKGLKFLGMLLEEGEKLSSQTRSGKSVEINEFIKEIYSNHKISLLKNTDSVTRTVELIKEKSPHWSFMDKRYLENLSKRNIFGFIVSCMFNDDWSNDNSVKNQKKGIMRLIDEVHKESLLKKVPSKTSSSNAIIYLDFLVRKTIK